MIADYSKLSIVVPLSIALGVMLSPESLTILGNGMGNGGTFFLIPIVLAVFAHFLTAQSYGKLPRGYPGLAAESGILRKSFGSIPATILPLSSRALFAVCASTGILATAGYVFNEVFVYWFPNLGFSFCLLGLLLLINLSGRKVTVAAQIILVAVTLVGLAFLVLVGFWGLVNGSAAAEPLAFSSVNLVGLIPVGLLLFIGHELALQARSHNGEGRGNPALLLLGGIVLMGVIFSAWGLISLKYVGMERLADSTIPHMIAARKILGQNGRIIVGIVVITGALSAVNGLLFSVSRMLSGMADEGLLPLFFAGKNDRATAGLLLLVLGIGAMMGLGMAGEPMLEVYTKASILFWLLNYAAVHLAMLISVRSGAVEFKESGVFNWHPLVSIIGLLIMLGGFRWLLWTDPNSGETVKFMFIVFGVFFAFTASWLGFRRIRRGPISMQTGKERINERTQTSDV